MRIDQYKIMYEVEDTHFWYQGMRIITQNLLDKYLPKKTNNKILDAGCGTGANMLFLKKYGDVYGFDISDEAIKFCKKRGIKNIKKAGVENTPYKSNSFDLITCFDVLGQMEVKKDNDAIKEFYRVLKPNGIIFIRVAAYNWLYSYHDKTVHTKQRYNKKILKQKFINKNFKILKTTYANMFLFPFIIIKRLLNKNVGEKINSDVNKVNFFINFLLKIIFFIEKHLLNYIDLPFGSSLIVICQK
jgi:ubiquinone/menaquinone biosynthesis C-methylase UbiE